mmetsp:Transcript_35812/g.73224  ORF Transcript_35812/g.73224 Transcript_35812/m.73224 type:complete len:522 (-) Transcript_35812:191-1756(-)|eukprot:CAMPEP_0183309226 /NCGR_PEP_ID=MMETSP0160_2-20130417/24581_1 /TAXON_ID=2839 ORGANISM="Odontella Sinensis, Strain Grunow 1884" /NCGR_SAMPLE_ID=MMETSP0160_2 /ASSEMBLY_ACC=CAM_ASM_000250 /LENGTH=521 /DNA_ID=CAMNT_0025473221 /DNA_START=72 /DNA_END=1637 /DNA_ORIENTATION=+
MLSAEEDVGGAPVMGGTAEDTPIPTSPPEDDPPPPPEDAPPPPPSAPATTSPAPTSPERAAGEGADPWVSGGSPSPVDESAEVFDPQQHGEGRSKYTTYCVVLRRGGQPKASVRRRYSDFKWLFGQLHKERPGSIIPIMPHKTAVRADVRMSEEIISYRRKHCEIWLNRLLTHPELKGCPSLLAFLKSDDDMFASAKKSNDMDVGAERDDEDEDKPMVWGGSSKAASGGGKERFTRIKKLASKVKVAMKSSSDLEKTDDEERFDAIDEYIQELDMNLQWLAKHAAGLVKTYADQSKALDAMGTNFTEMGALAYPNTHSSNSARLSTLLNKIGDGVSALGFLEDARTQALTARFEEPIQDLARDAQSLRDALQRRREVQVKYTEKITRTVRKTSELDKIRANPRAAENPDLQVKKIEEAERTLEEAKKDAVTWHDEFDAVSSRLLRETERFREMFRGKVRETISGWASVQMEYYSRSNDGWGDILPYLDAEDLVGADTAGGGYTLGGGGQNGASAPPVVTQI